MKRKLPDTMLDGAVTVQHATDLRNRVGQFMWENGVSLGDKLDAGKVQDLFVEWAKVVEREIAKLREERDALKRAANTLIDYIEAHDWGTIPEPFDSINPLLKLLGREPGNL